MKQILQNMSNGNTQLVEVPCPAPQPGHCIIGTTRTLVSVGTERMLVNFGKANLVIAIPDDWIDVQTIADLEEIAFEFKEKKKN